MSRPINPQPEARTGRHGTSWRVRFRHHGRQTSETFPSRAAAQDFCDDLRRHGVDRAMRLYEDKLRARDAETLDALLEDFLAWKTPRVRSDRTIADYRRAWDRWVTPTLGNLAAEHVTEADVQTWVDGMVAAGSSPKSIADRHALLHAVYKWAAAPSRRRVESDPCTATDLPKKRRKMPKGLTPAEYQALLTAMTDIDPDAADLIDFLVASGWRWSEATALSVGQVEDYGPVMRVTSGWVIRRDAKARDVRVEDVKGEGSLRRIALDPDAAAIVRRRCLGKRPGDLVLTTAEGYQWHYSNFRRRKWNPAVEAAGLTHRAPTPHWLRHTAVAWLAMSGANVRELQARVGHKSITTTMDVYGQMIDDVASDVVARAAALRTRPAALPGVIERPAIADAPAADGTGERA